MARILQAEGRGLTMIFTRTKRAADRVAEDLDFRGFAVAAVHGDLGQGARERALRAFRAGKIDILVATDVAARGLDVTGVTHVINYDCPEDPDTYTHRIGRTGRAGATGVAVTFVDWDDMPRWRIIDKTLGLDMPEPPETYHTSPHLYTDLDIPTDDHRHPADRRAHPGRPRRPRSRRTWVAGPAGAARAGAPGAVTSRGEGRGDGRGDGRGERRAAGAGAPPTPAPAGRRRGARRRRGRGRHAHPAPPAAPPGRRGGRGRADRGDHRRRGPGRAGHDRRRGRGRRSRAAAGAAVVAVSGRRYAGRGDRRLI